MAIYKLGEICNIKRGSSPRPINKWLRDKGLMWAKISDISKFSIMQTKQFIAKEWITKGLIGQKNDLFITNSATPGIPFLQLSNNPIAYHDGFVSIKPNKNLVSNKYLLYRLILDKSKLIKLGNGAIFVNLSCKIIGDWKVNIPSLKTQKQIIDIIEPVERLIFLTKSIIKIITKWYANKQIMEAKNKKIKDICLNSSNGFPYQKKHIDVKGIYKIFTIKNIKNSKNFSRTNFICNNKILVGDVVTGLSGTIGTTKIMDCDKWASNQRTLTINSKYFLEIKSIIEINMLKLLKIARGAAQKNISHFEILDLDISIKNYNHNISNTYLIMWRIVNLAKKIKKSLIELLIK